MAPSTPHPIRTARLPLPRLPSLHLPCLQLYQGLGYSEVGRDPVFAPTRRSLMRKGVLGCGSSSDGEMESSSSSSRSDRGSPTDSGGNSSGGRRPASRVYVWSDEAALESQAGQQGGSAGGP